MKIKKCEKTNKTSYPTVGVAKSELAWFKMENLYGNEEAKQIRYYKCEFCKMYHLTSKK